MEKVEAFTFRGRRRPSGQRPVVLLVAIGLAILIAGGCSDRADPLGLGAALALMSYCPGTPSNITIFGCRGMTQAERDNLGIQWSDTWPPAAVVANSSAVCGEYIEGGEDVLALNLSFMFVFDSLRVIDLVTNDTTWARGLIQHDGLGTLDLFGIQSSILGTTQSAVTVLHEGGHLRYPGLTELQIATQTEDCFDEFGTA
jgi:hypothetical protein